MLYAMNQLSITFRNSELALGWCIALRTTNNSGWMRVVIVALIALALASAHGAELLNSDFEDLKSRLAGTWSFTENGQSYDATFEAVAHAVTFDFQKMQIFLQ